MDKVIFNALEVILSDLKMFENEAFDFLYILILVVVFGKVDGGNFFLFFVVDLYSGVFVLEIHDYSDFHILYEAYYEISFVL